MQTGENIQALRKIMEMTRLFSLIILAIHFYIFCYGAFKSWSLTAEFSDRIVFTLSEMPLFRSELFSKAGALLLLIVSLIGVKGKKDEKIRTRTISTYLLTGLILYWCSHLLLSLLLDPAEVTLAYISTTMFGYILIVAGGSLLSRLLRINLSKDIFNKENETFPQEERLLENEYSVNLPSRYRFKGKYRNSWVNMINPFRGAIVCGTPGAGKSYFVIRHIIDQHLKKGFSMFLYDFKFSDLTLIAYNKLLKYYENYKVKPKFCLIDLDNPKNRCNPLHPEAMEDITDATEASRTIMLGLNREWIKKQGDFFVESPINFVTAIIWYLRKYKDGKFCTLPHVIELIQVDYDQLFPVIAEEEEIKVLINPFLSAFINQATDQLEGQIASAKICLARLSSPKLYYVTTGNDFSLDINNPKEPKIVCVGNNPQKAQVYGAVLSLYVNRMLKLVSKKGMLKSSLIFDEFPTIFLGNTSEHLGYARGYKISTVLGIQDYSQLKKDYGREQAEVIMNIVGNIICGQVTGDTAKQLSERFGKIVQDRKSLSINSSDTSISKSTQLDFAIPASAISSLSSGEFVGMVADDPDNKIELKVFHNEIINDHAAIKKEEEAYKPLPKIREVTDEEIQETYRMVKEDIEELIKSELQKLKDRKSKPKGRKTAKSNLRESVENPKKAEKRSLSL